MAQARAQSPSSPERLSFAQAARLTGLPKAYLRELAESGRLAVHLMPGSNGAVKQRVSRGALLEAGLLQGEDPVPARSELGELIDLIKEQSTRITTLEEQRFQLGAQLGAALERVSALEEQLVALPPANGSNGASDQLVTTAAQVVPARPSVDPSASVAATSRRSTLVRMGGRGVQRSTALGSQIVLRGVRLIGRVRSVPH